MSSLDFIGYYRTNAEGKKFVRNLGRETVEVVDWYLYNKLLDAGYNLDIRRDNKSVWSAEWIAKALKKFADEGEIDSSLDAHIERIVAVGSAASGANHKSGVPATQDSGSNGPFATVGSGVPDATIDDKVTRAPAPVTVRRGANIVPLSQVGAVSHSNGHVGRHEPGTRTKSARQRAVLANSGTRDSGGSGSEARRSDAYRHAKAAAFKAAGGAGRRSRPLSMDEVVEQYIHLSHHSGAPYFTRNELALGRAQRDAASIEAGTRRMDPYTAGKRIQHGDLEPKGRLVWMAPLSTTILGTRFAKPAYNGLVGRDCFAYARTAVSVGTFLSGLQSRHEFVYALDFSAFDASLPAWLIADVFEIIRSHLEMDESEERLFNQLVNDFIHSRLILPDLSIWQKHRGVPSGSAFTSLVDSIANYLIIQYVWIRLTGRGPHQSDVMVLGDDSVVGSDIYIDGDDLRAAASELGVNLNSRKSERVRSGGMVPFLGHHWSQSKPHRTKEETAKRMAFPERQKRRTKRDSVIRAYSFLQDSVEAFDVWNDMFPQRVQDVKHHILMTSAPIGTLESSFAREGPGLLTYKVEVEGREDLKKLRIGTRLFDVGLWY